jgi:hypothetical protein
MSAQAVSSSLQGDPAPLVAAHKLRTASGMAGTLHNVSPGVGSRMRGGVTVIRAFYRAGVVEHDPHLSGFFLTAYGAAVRSYLPEAMAVLHRTAFRHQTLALVSLRVIMLEQAGMYVSRGDEALGVNPDRLTRPMNELLSAKLVQAPGSAHSRAFRLTDLGMRTLMAWDALRGRQDLPLAVGPGRDVLTRVPPREVLVQKPTGEIVREYPAYYLSGPGWFFASLVDCGHGYWLTDSCSCC